MNHPNYSRFDYVQIHSVLLTSPLNQNNHKMKNLFTLQNLKFVLGFATGFIIYDAFAKDEIDWVKAIVVAILSVILMFVIDRLKK